MSSPLRATSTMHRFVRYDAAREIINAAGDLSGIELFGDQVICGPYVHSGLLWSQSLGFPIEKRLSLGHLYELYDGHKGLMAQQMSVESIYQGKVMLVIKAGEETTKVRAGDWIFTLQENTRMISVQTPTSQRSRVLDFIGTDYAAGWPSKLVYERDIYGRVRDPDMVV